MAADAPLRERDICGFNGIIEVRMGCFWRKTDDLARSGLRTSK
jgi:hypothetical protein